MMKIMELIRMTKTVKMRKMRVMKGDDGCGDFIEMMNIMDELELSESVHQVRAYSLQPAFPSALYCCIYFSGKGPLVRWG